MEIRPCAPTDAVVRQLLNEHLTHMVDISPEGSMHALDVDGLARSDVTMWAAWDGDLLLGCGALKALGARRGEVKSMRTRDAYRGRGVATRILERIIAEARRRSYDTILLETGSWAAFEPARRLYERHGFEYCGPFGDYLEDPNSVFMRKAL